MARNASELPKLHGRFYECPIRAALEADQTPGTTTSGTWSRRAYSRRNARRNRRHALV